jgi:hypothetical protein
MAREDIKNGVKVEVFNNTSLIKIARTRTNTENSIRKMNTEMTDIKIDVKKEERPYEEDNHLVILSKISKISYLFTVNIGLNFLV